MYKTKCDKCAAKIGDVDRQKRKKLIFSYADKDGKMRARCLKHLTAN